MDQADRTFDGSMPEVYERHLATALFAPYADHVAEVVAARAPRHIVEIAAGTGLVTRRLAQALPEARIVATDLNQPMLQEAARLFPSGSVEWRAADALELPFEDRSFDAAVCQFGAMFFPDRVAAYAQARRVLTADGRFVLAVWDRIEDNDFDAVAAEVVRAAFPDDPPDFLARIPHGYADPDRITADLTAAGFSDVTVDHVVREGWSPSARDLAVGFCLGTPTRAAIAERDPDAFPRVIDTLTEAFTERFGAADLRGRLAAYVVTASS